MEHIELTLPTATENVALDEVLLLHAERTDPRLEYLRIWEPTAPMVVIGRASRVADEVNLAVSEQRGIPVIRRCSGGAAIVAMPGCLMYACVLSIELRPQLQAVDQAHRFVLGRLSDVVSAMTEGVSVRGLSDLALGEQKFSGNSLRCKKTHLLYHGTMLFDADLSLVSLLLGSPPRQPDYRRQRSHDEFLTNLPVGRESLRDAVKNAFASQAMADWPRGLTQRLVEEKYSRKEWNQRL